MEDELNRQFQQKAKTECFVWSQLTEDQMFCLLEDFGLSLESKIKN